MVLENYKYDDFKRLISDVASLDEEKMLFSNGDSDELIAYPNVPLEIALQKYLFKQYAGQFIEKHEKIDSRPNVLNVYNDCIYGAIAAVALDYNYIAVEENIETFKRLDSFFDGFGNSINGGFQFAVNDKIYTDLPHDYVDVIFALASRANSRCEASFDYWKELIQAYKKYLSEDGYFIYVVCQDNDEEYMLKEKVVAEFLRNDFELLNLSYYVLYSSIFSSIHYPCYVHVFKKPKSSQL